MNKGLFKIAVVFTALSICANAYASEVTGSLSTGLGNAVEGIVVAPPTASPAAGSYSLAQNIALSASSSTSIHYTINGTDPTCTDTNVYSTSTPIAIKSTKTIRAISCYPNSVSSSVGSYAYSLSIVDGSTENITPSSSNTGEASLPTGATSIKLSNTTSMDLSASVNTAVAGGITVSGVEKQLNDFTSGNLSSVNLSVAISISDQTITVGKAVSMQSGVDGQAMVLTNSDLSNARVSIPDNTTVLAPAGWDGMINPPKAGSSSGSAPSGFSVGSIVVEVGSTSGVLLFDKPVSVVLSGVTGNVGYKASGSSTWVQITSACGGSYNLPLAPAFPGECYISNGTDTKIYTYHFTTFASLASAPIGGVSGSGGGGSVSYTIIASAGSNGSISPAGYLSLVSGSNQTYTIIPGAGYKVSNVLVDGVSKGAITTYTFSNISSAHAISAVFSAADSPAVAKSGDANWDNKIDLLDFNKLMVDWDSTGSGIASDFDGNGVVDILDFNLLMINWTS